MNGKCLDLFWLRGVEALVEKMSPDLIIFCGKSDLYERGILKILLVNCVLEMSKIQMENGRQYGKMKSMIYGR